MNSSTYGIGRAARESACKIETIRYYESIGLLQDPGRTAGGHRVYRRQHIQQLIFIRRSRQLGFSLREVQTLLSLSSDGGDDCKSVQQMALQHLQTIKAKISDLQKLEKVLTTLSDECAVASDQVCPILQSLNSRVEAQ